MSDHNNLNNLDDKVNLKGYFERILTERDRVDEERDKRLDERFQAQELAVRFALTEREKAVNAALTAAKEAVTKAETAAKETMKSHNDLIRQSRDRDATYATQIDVKHIAESIGKIESFQSKLVGIALTVPLVSSVIVYLLAH